MGELAILPQTHEVSDYRRSTDAAGLCRDIVIKTAMKIQQKRYVTVEGWQAIAIAHGCAASADNVERVNDEGMSGFKAIGTIRRMSDGQEIARAEGFLGDDEGMWAKRPVYARRAMAQTRAISRACRSAFAHVVVMIDAGLSTTPAEEVPMGGFENRRTSENAVNQPHASPPKPDWPDGPCKGISALKTASRTLWREISSAPDVDSFDALLVSEKPMLQQIRLGWHDGWNGDGADFEGFGPLIARKRAELLEEAEAGDAEPVAGDNGNTILDAG